MFIDWRRGNENDPWLMSYHERVRDDGLQILLEVIDGNMLFVRSLGQRRIIGTKEDELPWLAEMSEIDS